MRLSEKERRELLAFVGPEPPRVKPTPKMAEVVPFPPKLSEQGLARRQAAIDLTWERVLARRREIEAEAARCCHIGPGDPDWKGAA